MDEPGRTLIQSSAARDVGEVIDAIDGRIDGTRHNVVGGVERITGFRSVSVHEIEHERSIAPLLHVGYTGDEGASRLARECADFGERAVTGLIWPNDLAGDVAADVLAHADSAEVDRTAGDGRQPGQFGQLVDHGWPGGLVAGDETGREGEREELLRGCHGCLRSC